MPAAPAPVLELRELLVPEHIVIPLEAGSLQEAVAVLLRRLAEEGGLIRPDALESALAEIGARDVVAVTDDVALPHHRTGDVERLTVALGVSRAPLASDVDGVAFAPRVVVLILAPRDASGPYLQTVSALARLFRDEAVAERVATARDAQEVLALPELRGLRIQPRLAVRDIMIHQDDSVAPDGELGVVVDLMVRRGIRALPVVGAKGEVLGMVTDRDVMRALLPAVPRASEGEEARETEPAPRARKVRDVMSRSVLCISEDMGVSEAASMMVNKDVEQLPVVSEGKLTGMLTRSEIIRKLLAR
ncbi:MAG TPA: CBS domain-containing protein [Longimicrobiales bacterium]|nr:CBS domain-containing protein [Longimicrobiales bacterium]